MLLPNVLVNPFLQFREGSTLGWSLWKQELMDVF